MLEVRWQTECKPCKYFLNMTPEHTAYNSCHSHITPTKVFNLQSEKGARAPLPPGTSVSKLERANFKEKTHHKRVESRVTPVQQKAKPKKHRLPKQAGEHVQRSVMDNVTTSTTKTYAIRKQEPSGINRIQCYVDSSFGERPLAGSQTGHVSCSMADQ